MRQRPESDDTAQESRPPSAGASGANSGPAPTPRTVAASARPAAPSPAALAGTAGTPTRGAAPGHAASSEPTQPSAHDAAASLERARRHGRADAHGTVYVRVAETEHVCGQYPDATPDEALAYFARKYDDAQAQLDLLDQRLAAHAPTGEMRKTVQHVRDALEAKAMVGDLPALAERLEDVTRRIGEARDREKAEHERAKAENLAVRTAIVEAAEQVAGQDPAKTQWKHSSARMAELFDQWKAQQRSGVRLSKPDEDRLWKRLRTARTSFDRARKAFFSSLDENNAKAKRVKEALIAQAEELNDSTDWGPTAAKYRDLMEQWKAAPRASRREDDALWARFRAAQDVFFNARAAAQQRVDQEFEANLRVKEGLLEQARALLPVTDLAAAKKRLGELQEQWEQAGMVPRGHVRRIESALREVEDAVKAAEDESWKRSDPETKARTDSVLGQLEAKIERQRADLDAARERGDTRRVATLEAELATSQQWWDTLQRSASHPD